MKTTTPKGWIPVWKYAKNMGTSEQNVYRWIREGKIPPTAFKREQVIKERLLVKEDFDGR